MNHAGRRLSPICSMFSKGMSITMPMPLRMDTPMFQKRMVRKDFRSVFQIA